jgi:uncharacterized protein
MTSGANMSGGSVVALWRYPVKSMMGEELNATCVGPRGLLGDRLYAIVDPDTGKVASAKNPKKWPYLFDYRAAYVDAPNGGVDALGGDGIPTVRITFPDGQITCSDDAGLGAALTAMLGRPATLQTAVPDTPILEEYWPDMEELEQRDVVTDESLPEGTFFDLASVHILTTGTIDGLRAAYPGGRFEARRFRPNIIVETPPEDGFFPETRWIGRRLAIGDEVRMEITDHCPRCVMTTLPQGDLPRDPGILRAAAQHNEAHVGIYAEVTQGGAIRRGDTVRLL